MSITYMQMVLLTTNKYNTDYSLLQVKNQYLQTNYNNLYYKITIKLYSSCIQFLP
jgi:hypothetical protein